MVSDVSKTQSAKINTRPSMEMILLSFIVIFLRVLTLAINLVYSILRVGNLIISTILRLISNDLLQRKILYSEELSNYACHRKAILHCILST